jgi:hypothetical protein
VPLLFSLYPSLAPFDIRPFLTNRLSPETINDYRLPSRPIQQLLKYAAHFTTFCDLIIYSIVDAVALIPDPVGHKKDQPHLCSWSHFGFN